MEAILIVNDIAGRGKVAGIINQVVLSCAGYDTALLPTVLLSDRTGRGAVVREGMTPFVLETLQAWRNTRVVFGGALIGYCADCMQLQEIMGGLKTMAIEGPIILDPIMADQGRLYSGFTDDYIEAMRRACANVDVVLPNLTEACLLANVPYSTTFNPSELKRICHKIRQLGAKKVVITGIESGTKIGCYTDEGSWYETHRYNGQYAGTGDLFASCFAVQYLAGVSLEKAIPWAQKFVASAIQDTQSQPYPSGNLYFENQLQAIIVESRTSDEK